MTHLTKKLFLLSVLLIFSIQFAFPQKQLKNLINKVLNKEQQKADSLLKVIQKAKNDTLRTDLYFQYFELTESPEWIKYAPSIINTSDSLLKNKSILANLQRALLKRKAIALRYCYYYYNNTEGAGCKKGIALIYDAIKIFAEIGDDVELTQTYMNLADDYFRQGNLFKQYQTLEEGLKHITTRKFKRGVSRFYVQLQLFYANMGDTMQALNYLDKAIELEKEINDPTRLANGYYSLGLAYSRMLKHKKAIDYFLLSIKSYENKNMQNRDRVLSRAYLILGDEYQKIKEYNKAIDIYDKNIKYGIKSENFRAVFLSTLAKGKTLSLQGEFNKAIKIHNEILKTAKDLGVYNEGPGRMCNEELAQDYYRHGDYSKAKKHIEHSLELAKSENLAIVDLCNIEQIVYKIDSAGNYFEDAFQHYQNYNVLKEKINKEEALKLAGKDRFNSEIQIQKTEQQKKDAIAKKEIEQQKIVRNSFVGGFALMFLLAGVSYRNFRRKKKDNQIITQQKTEVEKQKHLVEEKNREILDSIEYALRIQTAILPPQKIVKHYLENSFILYKPKDIVAGDFYWMESIGDVVLFAACDCTGHGVPGAMVSVVCHNALNRAVREFGLTQPASILDKTAEIVLENFSKSDEEIHDGMDISICALNTKTKTLEWAGAYNPLLLINNGQLTETKSDKQCIGYNDNVKPFTNHQFNLQPDTSIYLLQTAMQTNLAENVKENLQKIVLENYCFQSNIYQFNNKQKNSTTS